MGASSFGDRSLRSFVDELASSEPVPGGGSAAAVAASLAAALVAMVAELSDRPRYQAHAALHVSALATGRRLAARSLELADEDSAAYAAFGAARRLPRDSDEERAARDASIATAARAAAEVPLETVRVTREIAAAAESLAGRSNVNASSDLIVAALLSEAAGRGAALNVEVNLPSVGDPEWARQAEGEVGALLSDVARFAAATRETVARGEERPPVEAVATVGAGRPDVPASR